MDLPTSKEKVLAFDIERNDPHSKWDYTSLVYTFIDLGLRQREEEYKLSFVDLVKEMLSLNGTAEKLDILLEAFINRGIIQVLLLERTIAEKIENTITEDLIYAWCDYDAGSIVQIHKKLENLKGTSVFHARFYYKSYVIINHRLWQHITGIIDAEWFSFDSYYLESYIELIGGKLESLEKEDFKKLNPRGRFFQFRFGKHTGKTLEQVMQDDPQYLVWMVLNNFYFSIDYPILDKLIKQNIPANPSLLIFITTLKNELCNSVCKIYYYDEPIEYDGTEEEQDFYDRAEYDLLTGGEDYDNFDGDWDKLDDEFGR